MVRGVDGDCGMRLDREKAMSSRVRMIAISAQYGTDKMMSGPLN
jgi:hypothetical protein